MVAARRALIFGASGGLAQAVADKLLAEGWNVDLATRAARKVMVRERFEEAIAAGRVKIVAVQDRYTELEQDGAYDAYVFNQALFEPKPLVETSDARVQQEIAVGLTEPIELTRSILRKFPPAPEARVDFAFIGSTSAYAGFKNTAVYCAVKHGLVGFVRAMNDEYGATQTRFWLFSMGTMNTEMGALLVDQEPSSFLQPEDVATRIVESIASPSNVFEPEVLMRRRTIRFRNK